MASDGLRIKDLFPDWTTDAWNAFERLEAGRDLKVTVGSWRAVTWEAASGYVWKRMTDYVDELDVLAPLFGAWTKYRQLRQYADPTQYGPDETLLLSLREHTISASHRPTLEVLIGEQVVKKISFEIVLALTMEAVVLEVRDARIREIVAGRCRGKGSVKCAGATLVEQSTRTIELPGIALGAGIPIPAPERPVAATRHTCRPPG